MEVPKSEVISVSSISVFPGTEVRFSLNEERVQFFFDLYQDKDHRIPPILCFKDNKGEIFIADGSHRLEAQTRHGKLKVPAEIKNCINHDEIKRKILLAAYASNDKSSLPFTKEERKEAVRKMYDSGITRQILEKLVPPRTLDRWLADAITGKQVDRIKIDAVVEDIKVHKPGIGKRKIAAMTGLSIDTIKHSMERIKKSDTENGAKTPNGVSAPPPTKPLENKENQSAESPKTDKKCHQKEPETSSKNDPVIAEINRHLRDMRDISKEPHWSKEAQKKCLSVVKFYSKKSKDVQSLIGGDLLHSKIFAQGREHNEFKCRVRQLSKSNFILKEKNEELRKEIRGHKDRCRTSCKIGKGALANLYYEYLSALFSALTKFVAQYENQDFKKIVLHDISKRILEGGISCSMHKGIMDVRAKEIYKDIQKLVNANAALFKEIKFTTPDGRTATSSVMRSLQRLEGEVTYAVN